MAKTGFRKYHNVEFDLSFQEIKNDEVLLAHYTSMENVFKIVASEEIWLSNPLMMNDVQEMKHGLTLGLQEFDNLCKRHSGYMIYKKHLSTAKKEFEERYSDDTYVFCLTEHDKEKHEDGLLSMWRGYGHQGCGAAIVFNNRFIDHSGRTPLLILKINYVPHDERNEHLKSIRRLWCERLEWTNHRAGIENGFDKQALERAAEWLFDALLVDALRTKHDGFKEEQEWRLIYIPYRPRSGLLRNCLNYSVGAGGVERKLKLPIVPVLPEHQHAWSFQDILDRIIIGPAVQSPMAKASFRRAVELTGKGWIAEKVFSSTIPLRSVPGR